MLNMNKTGKKEVASGLYDQIKRYVGGFLILPDASAMPKDVISNGTALFLDTGEGQFVITNHHVYADMGGYLLETPRRL